MSGREGGSLPLGSGDVGTFLVITSCSPSIKVEGESAQVHKATHGDTVLVKNACEHVPKMTIESPASMPNVSSMH